MIAKTEETENMKKLKKPYLAGRFILWKSIVFSVFSVVLVLAIKKKWKTEKKKHENARKKQYLAGGYILWKILFFSVFSIVLVLAPKKKTETPQKIWKNWKNVFAR